VTQHIPLETISIVQEMRGIGAPKHVLVAFVHKRHGILLSTYDLAEVTKDAVIARLVPGMVISETDELMLADPREQIMY
jgi:hypothetical protein